MTIEDHVGHKQAFFPERFSIKQILTNKNQMAKHSISNRMIVQQLLTVSSHRLTMENLEQFQHMLSEKTPLFQVDAVLVPPDITMRPTQTEVCNILGYNVKHFLNRYVRTAVFLYDIEFKVARQFCDVLVTVKRNDWHNVWCYRSVFDY